ncbi:MAG: hypothetical protein IPM83_11395 [Ignavibacteria bacterium]|nr:hypothetical protein [Ignavibacteria bacterium]
MTKSTSQIVEDNANLLYEKFKGGEIDLFRFAGNNGKWIKEQTTKPSRTAGYAGIVSTTTDRWEPTVYVQHAESPLRRYPCS